LNTEIESDSAVVCAHCGALAGVGSFNQSDLLFCCQGCALVYQIINTNGLCDYYNLSPKPGISRKSANDSHWKVDELNLMENKFLIFEDKNLHIVSFYIPQMHCASCIWLLERLGELDNGVGSCRVDFYRKQLNITYNPQKTSFGNIVLLLRSLGYEPALQTDNKAGRDEKVGAKTLTKLGVAGFCAGNIMLFSFPEYFGLNIATDNTFVKLFHTLNILLSIPLIFYCVADYFKAFYQWVTKTIISVKVPLALGLGALWLRSVYEVLSASGPGYFDSFAGLCFFLILGSWLQNKTMNKLRFGDPAISFFPLVATTQINGKRIPKKVEDLNFGDRVFIANGEIIPADGILMVHEAWIDYAFATGENTPVQKMAGEIIFGGGKNCGGAFEMEIIRSFDKSKMAEIWKMAGNIKEENYAPLNFEKLISKYFIFGTLLIAILGFTAWSVIEPSRSWFVLVAVLMVACPCALALAPPFAYNTIAGAFSRHGLFLRKPEVVGEIGDAQAIVFDKTGTLTTLDGILAEIPDSYLKEERILLASLAQNSNHPYSNAIFKALLPKETLRIKDFYQISGKGIGGAFDKMNLKLGSKNWILQNSKTAEVDNYVWFSIGDRVLEPIKIGNHFHSELHKIIDGIYAEKLDIHIASGDNDNERKNLQHIGRGKIKSIEFNLSPAQKVSTILNIQNKQKAIMVGDGLNDAGALKTGNVGMVVTASTNNFIPEADAILMADSLHLLPQFIRLCKKANRVIKETFIVSLIYNLAALTLALTGNLSPLIAAILMPGSSIFLMLYAKQRSLFISKKMEYKI
jgi:Cu+-exporting ATPase